MLRDRSLVALPKTCHITPLLASLHWLKIKERIEYKLLSLAYKILTTSPATYLHNLVSLQSPRGTCSSIAIRHTVPTRITKCTKFGQLILRKIIIIVATRCQILRLKCTQFDFGWGSAPDPAGGAYMQRSPYPLPGFKGPTSKGREGRGRKGGQGEGGRCEVLLLDMLWA